MASQEISKVQQRIQELGDEINKVRAQLLELNKVVDSALSGLGIDHSKLLGAQASVDAVLEEVFGPVRAAAGPGDDEPLAPEPEQDQKEA